MTQQVDQSAVDAFNSALEKNKQERKAKEEQRLGGGKGNFEVVQWCGLEDKVEKVVRILGNPIEVRKVGTDPKLIFFSKVLNDKKDGYMNVVWKTNQEGQLDEDWILYELYSFIMKREWKKYSDGHKNEKGYDGEYEYFYRDSETFKRIFSNLKKNASPKFKAPKVKPKNRVLMNVIDRHDNWCKENKHSKLLTSKIGYWKDDEQGNPINFPDMGIPEVVYSNIMDQVVAFRRHWFLDVVIIKKSDDMSYIVKDILEDKLNPKTKEIGSDNPLTEEELSFELYNFDEMRMFKTSTYTALNKRLIGLFKMCDAEHNTHFTEKLEEKVAEEQKTMTEEERKKAEESLNEETNEENVQVQQEQKSQEREQIQTRRSASTVSEEVNYEQKFPSWNLLSPVEQSEMKKKITGFKENVPVYSDPSEVLPCIDSNCKFVSSSIQTSFPLTVYTCPVCGKVDKPKA